MKSLAAIALILSAAVLPSVAANQSALREGTYFFEIPNSQNQWTLKLVLEQVERIPTYSGEHLLYTGKLVESYVLSSGKTTEHIFPIEAEGLGSVVIGKPGSVRKAIRSEPNWETWVTGYYYEGGWDVEKNAWIGTLRLHESDPFGKRDVKLFASSAPEAAPLSIIRIPEGEGTHLYYTDVQEDVTLAQAMLDPDGIFPELDPDVLFAYEKLHERPRIVPTEKFHREPSGEVLCARLEYKAEEILERRTVHFQLWSEPPSMPGGTIDVNRPPNGVDYAWDPAHARGLYLAMSHRLREAYGPLGNGYNFEYDFLHRTNAEPFLLWLKHFLIALSDFSDAEPNEGDAVWISIFFSALEARRELLESFRLYQETRGAYEMARVPGLELAHHRAQVTVNEYYKQVRAYLEQLWMLEHGRR